MVIGVIHCTEQVAPILEGEGRGKPGQEQPPTPTVASLTQPCFETFKGSGPWHRKHIKIHFQPGAIKNISKSFYNFPLEMTPLQQVMAVIYRLPSDIDGNLC